MKDSRSQSTSGKQKLISIDEILYARPQMPKSTTRNRGWGGVTVDVHGTYCGCSERYRGLDHHLICYCPTGGSRLRQVRGEQAHESVISAGMSYLMPAGYDSLWEGDAGESARLRMPTSLVDAAAEQLGKRCIERVEIRNVFETRDPVIERLAVALMVELEMDSHPAQLLIVDSVSTALAAHMIRRYNVFESRERETDLLLSHKELERLTAFVEDNVGNPIRLAQLAQLVNVSCFHFARIFKKTTGFTPIRFVERCRINHAKNLIAESDLPLAEIALAAGFADQSHFTRRFHRVVGSTPATFARDQGRRRSHTSV